MHDVTEDIVGDDHIKILWVVNEAGAARVDVFDRRPDVRKVFSDRGKGPLPKMSREGEDTDLVCEREAAIPRPRQLVRKPDTTRDG